MGQSNSSPEVLQTEKDRRAVVKAATNPLASLLPVLRESLTGNVFSVLDEDPTAYEECRSRPWNKDTHGFPALICRVKDQADIAAVFAFSRTNSLPLGVAGGCHSSKSMVDGSCVIDLALLDTVAFRPETGVVSVGGGCLLGAVDALCSEHGVTVPLGTNPYTGIAGLTLAGGSGFLGRKWGFTCDSIVALDAVLPDGRAIHATVDNEHREFLWACRGGGGNFGVITTFHFATHVMPSGGNVACYDTVYLCPTEASFKDTLERVDVFLRQSDNDVTSVVALPCGAPVIPINWIGVLEGLNAGDTTVPQPLLGAGTLGGWFKLANKCNVVSFHGVVQKMLIPHQESGYYFEAVVGVKELNDVIIDTLYRFTRKRHPNSTSAVLIFPLMGACRTPSEGGNVLLHRGCNYWIIVEGKWENSAGVAGREKTQAWTRALCNELKAIDGNTATAHAMSETESHEQEVEKIFDEHYQRLRAAKARYDPTNVLRLNRNISPAK